MYIKRHLEEVIRECLEQFPIVLVTGPRQIGKTILLKNVCSEYKVSFYTYFANLLHGIFQT